MLGARKIIFLVFFLPSFFSFAQQKDAVLWTSLNVEKKINKHFSATFLNQYILNQNFHELGLYFFDAGLFSTGWGNCRFQILGIGCNAGKPVICVSHRHKNYSNDFCFYAVLVNHPPQRIDV